MNLKVEEAILKTEVIAARVTLPMREVIESYAEKEGMNVSEFLNWQFEKLFPNDNANLAMAERRIAKKEIKPLFLLDRNDIEKINVLPVDWPSDCKVRIDEKGEFVAVPHGTVYDFIGISKSNEQKSAIEWYDPKKALPHAQRWLFIEMNCSIKGVKLAFYNEITKQVNIPQMYNTSQYFSCDLADLKRWAYLEMPTV